MLCARCSQPTTRVALLAAGVWACAACHPPVACSTCGAEAAAFGVDRFAIGSADSDRYGLYQCVGYRCAAGHVTGGAVHRGPGAAG